MEVESTLGKGSAFTFYMPIPEPEIEETVQNDETFFDSDRVSKEDLSKTRILIVEDDSPNRFFLEALVNSLGMSYDSCETGEEAVSLFSPKLHRVILMDIFLPEMNGEEAAEIIRKKSGKTPVHIIAQTAGGAKRSRSDLLAAGIDDFVPKPIGVEAIKQAIFRGMQKTA